MKPPVDSKILVEHLFRHESGKMIAVLTKYFGAEQMPLAEDIVQDTFVEAIKNWTFNGIPDNPTAWLYKVAKNKALNHIKRDKYKGEFINQPIGALKQNKIFPAPVFLDREIEDDQLRMIFTCCHPSISSDSQVALVLKTLCGFSIDEIAKAFLSSNENINKRLVRARRKIKEHKIPFEVPHGKELNERLTTVMAAIYLLFNEGYKASSGHILVRKELCWDAIRLAELIAEHQLTSHHSNIQALLSLMLLNASRFNARQDEKGNLITLEFQDRSTWDYGIMKKGFTFLDKATRGDEISIYHILASISACHCSAATFKETNWLAILQFYDKLLEFSDSPIVLLNRAVALALLEGPESGMIEIEKISKEPSIASNHLFYSVQAQFYYELGQVEKSISTIQQAISLCTLSVEQNELMIRKKRYEADQND